MDPPSPPASFIGCRCVRRQLLCRHESRVQGSPPQLQHETDQGMCAYGAIDISTDVSLPGVFLQILAHSQLSSRYVSELELPSVMFTQQSTEDRQPGLSPRSFVFVSTRPIAHRLSPTQPLAALFFFFFFTCVRSDTFKRWIPGPAGSLTWSVSYSVLLSALPCSDGRWSTHLATAIRNFNALLFARR